MKLADIRKIHKTLGIIISPFIFIMSFSAIFILLEHNKIVTFPDYVNKLIVNIHTWSILGHVTVFLIPILLLVIVITGIIIYR